VFDRVHLINLDRRPDRLAQFWDGFGGCGWPFTPPSRVVALDGQRIPRPRWYTEQAGAWGCLQTHLRLYEQAMDDDLDAIFIFEDDCVFADDCSGRIEAFFDHLPPNWEQVYLGGLPRRTSTYPPEQINCHVWRIPVVTGTWAMGLKVSFLRKIYPFMHEVLRETEPVGSMCHLDRMYAEYHLRHKPRVYAPVPWLVGAKGGRSDICNRIYTKAVFFNYNADRTGVECSEMLGVTTDTGVITPIASMRFRNGMPVRPSMMTVFNPSRMNIKILRRMEQLVNA